MNLIRLLLTLANVLTCFLSQTYGADKYTDENRPYEFGFTIDGQQHRHEKKDKNGIIMGEFGFITADDVYHVTVYATDEQGRFKILSMKNIHLKGANAATSARQGHSLQVPSTHQAPFTQVITTSTTPQLNKNLGQQFVGTSLEPPANSCSHCSLPTTSTAAPKIFPSISQPNSNNINTGVMLNNAQYSPQVQSLSSYNTPENNFGTFQSTAEQFSSKQNKGLPFKPSQNNLTPGINNYEQSLGIQNNNLATNANDGVNYPQNLISPPNYSQQGITGPGQTYPQSIQLNSSPQYLNPQTNTATQNYLQKFNAQQKYQTNKEENYKQGGPGFAQPAIELNSNTPQYPQQNGGKSTFGFNVAKGQINGLPDEIPQSGFIDRTPKQFEGESKPVSGAPNQKPTLAYAQMQIVDKNTDIYKKAPGENEGLPPGLAEHDMVRLLYTFNYTLGFQGHFEEGYSNGVKQGYYFVTGRNGVRTRVDYTADDTGFHPKITQDILDLLSEEVPKPETEKEEKYGLKGYEFKWLYYPVDSRSR